MIAFLTVSLVIVLRPKDVLRTKNSVIAVFPCVSEKNYDNYNVLTLSLRQAGARVKKNI